MPPKFDPDPSSSICVNPMLDDIQAVHAVVTVVTMVDSEVREEITDGTPDPILGSLIDASPMSDPLPDRYPLSESISTEIE